MKNQTKFNIADEATPETTNAIEVANTETHEIALAMPDGLDLSALMSATAALDKAEVSMALKADYLEMTTQGQTFRCIFLGYGTAKHQSPNEGEGLVEKKCVKLLGADKKAYINSSVLLVREFENAGLSVGTPIQITFTGQKSMPNGFKAKTYELHLLG